MTNEQLAVLLTGYADRLSDAVAEIEGKLPEECRRTDRTVLQTTAVTYPVLQPLYNLAAEFQDAIRTLERKT